jgi:hypothetical protein
VNAYTLADIGICRIAKELIPDEAEGEGHAQ